MPDLSSSPLRRAAVVGIGLVVVALVSVAFMEGVLRLFFPLPPGGELIRVVRQERPGLHSVVVYQRNAFGLRTRTLNSIAKPPHTIRVMAFGASTTDQITQNIEDSWVGIVEDRLRTDFADSGMRVETAGFGRGGLKMDYLVHVLPTMVRVYQPDLVITLLGVNDLAWNGGPDYHYSGFAHPAEGPPDAPRTSQARTCADVSQLCRRLARLVQRIETYQRLRRGKSVRWQSRRLEVQRARLRELPRVDAPRRDPDPIREFRDGMTLILDALVKQGVDAVVLGQPVLWKADLTPAERHALWFQVLTPQGPVRASGSWLAAEMARYNDVQRRLAERRGFVYLDLDERIPKDLDHYIDDCHYTDLGSHEVAREVLRVVEPRVARLVEARRRSGS